MAVFISPKLENSVSQLDIKECSVSFKVDELQIVNIYKPPSLSWEQDMFPDVSHPAVCVGDFNSRHTDWGYSSCNSDGEALANWAACNDLALVYDAKQGGSFLSARWVRPTNPDLCFVTRDKVNLPLPTSQLYLKRFPRSQHRPIVTRIGLSIPVVKSPPIARWNLKRADWERYKNHIETYICQIPPNISGYRRFTGLLRSAAIKSIPRGFRTQYIPCWNSACEELWNEYNNTEDDIRARELSEELLKSLNDQRKARWIHAVEDLDFTHSSRKSWALLRRLGASENLSTNHGSVGPDAVAASLLKTSQVKVNLRHKRKVKRELHKMNQECPQTSEITVPVSIEEIDNALRKVKNGKSAGHDGVLPEFLTHLGPKARHWLSLLFSNVLTEGKIPDEWREAKVIAVLKPGKDASDVKSYRPISLLSCIYKLFERTLLARLEPIIDSVVPKEQAGFRKGRSCAEQVLGLTTYIESGFQAKRKTGAVFLDLTSAYDTVWIQGLLLKVAKTVKSRQIVSLFRNMLFNRKLYVVLNGKKSRYKILQNGLPQGSVLAPVLFNLYISDMPDTHCQKFMYADDIAITTQASKFQDLEKILNPDLSKIISYLSKWCLKANPNKTVCTSFHLTNSQAKRPLDIFIGKTKLVNEEAPKYLGIKLDRSLTYRQHLKMVRSKIQTRNNLLSKLASTAWGSGADVLQRSAMALVFSVAEYCAPVWLESSHTKHLDIELKKTMRIISGTLLATPEHWLPVLSYIEPPDLRRIKSSSRLWEHIDKTPSLPIHQILEDQPAMRLKSRKPPWLSCRMDSQSLTEKWQERCQLLRKVDGDVVNVSTPPIGFSLPRRAWVRLNRIRAGCGRVRASMYRWGLAETENCECGGVQTLHHITDECPQYRFPTGAAGLLTLSPDALVWLSEPEIPI